MVPVEREANVPCGMVFASPAVCLSRPRCMQSAAETKGVSKTGQAFAEGCRLTCTRRPCSYLFVLVALARSCSRTPLLSFTSSLCASVDYVQLSRAHKKVRRIPRAIATTNLRHPGLRAREEWHRAACFRIDLLSHSQDTQALPRNPTTKNQEPSCSSVVLCKADWTSQFPALLPPSIFVSEVAVVLPSGADDML